MNWKPERTLKKKPIGTTCIATRTSPNHALQEADLARLKFGHARKSGRYMEKKNAHTPGRKLQKNYART